MPVTIGWGDIALRLVLTVIAGGLIGLNRGEHGRPAGLRTVLLVTLAASISMIQMNLLMPTNGKPHDSFAVMDLMRLPLGILTGVGFIGAGAILRRDSMVLGVTTAATLWYVTVMGLCFGGGQIGLGIAACVLGMFVLWVLKWAEAQLPQDHQATLCLIATEDGPAAEDVRQIVGQGGYLVASIGITRDQEHQRREFSCQVRWRHHATADRPPKFVEQLAHSPGVIKLKWTPLGVPLTA